MPSLGFESDYLNIKVSASTENEQIALLLEYINSYPEGSAYRLEMEARLWELVARYAHQLSEQVRATGRLTLYDND